MAQQEVLETALTEWVIGMIFFFISLFCNLATWWYTVAIKIRLETCFKSHIYFGRQDLKSRI